MIASKASELYRDLDIFTRYTEDLVCNVQSVVRADL